jgi:hypothetical protein
VAFRFQLDLLRCDIDDAGSVVFKRNTLDNAPSCLYSLLPFAIPPAIDVGLWLSLVERFVRVEEVESSNLSSPTISKTFSSEALEISQNTGAKAFFTGGQGKRGQERFVNRRKSIRCILKMPRKISSEKYDYLASERLTFTLEETCFLLHGHRTVERFRRARMLTPIVLETRRVVFSRDDVRACQIAIKNGKVPMEPMEALPVPGLKKETLRAV